VLEEDNKQILKITKDSRKRRREGKLCQPCAAQAGGKEGKARAGGKGVRKLSKERKRRHCALDLTLKKKKPWTCWMERRIEAGEAQYQREERSKRRRMVRSSLISS